MTKPKARIAKLGHRGNFAKGRVNLVKPFVHEGNEYTVAHVFLNSTSFKVTLYGKYPVPPINAHVAHESRYFETLLTPLDTLLSNLSVNETYLTSLRFSAGYDTVLF